MANRLSRETSPYLLQHAGNPVDWYPWGEEALARAKAEDKPLILSVGYSACHWCHVMERESFEDHETAAIMNRDFVSVKVDREERPDIDDLYMNAVQAFTGGHGGWPMTVFLRPDGRPFLGGTYFPREPGRGLPSFRQVMARAIEIYRGDRETLDRVSAQVVDMLQQSRRLLPPEGTPPFSWLDPVAESAASNFDEAHGGFGGAPKFPPHGTLAALLAHARTTGSASSLAMVTRTLDGMARGGMYDLLGGGFARYSVDARWAVPHFEKMLYDNAQLVPIYLDAYLVTRNGHYRDIARETLDWVLREMTHPEGGFYAAQDADSEGVEGKFFVFTPGELVEVLGPDDGRRAAELFTVTDEGTFEHGSSVLRLRADRAALDAETLAFYRRVRPVLFAARERRIRPGLDDKVIAAWNGMMIGAFARACAVLGDPQYRRAAEHAAEHALERMVVGGRLMRTWKNGQARHRAFLDDHALLGLGLIDLYEATLDPRWLTEVVALADRTVALFWDPTEGGFFYAGSDAEPLIARSKDMVGGATPAGNGSAALLFVRLEALAGRSDLGAKAAQVLRSYQVLLDRAPRAIGYEAIAGAWSAGAGRELGVVGALDDPRTQALIAEVNARYLPFRVLGHLPPDAPPALLPWMEGKTAIGGAPTGYLCSHGACQAPAPTLEDWRAQLERAESPTTAEGPEPEVRVRAPALPRDPALWLNVAAPLELEALRGRVVILDFWTYCCINCMHVLPELAAIEARFAGDPLVVIGVHASKFPAEKEAENVALAVARHRIAHPVVLDPERRVWREYAIKAWPTVAVLDVEGRIAWQKSGEVDREDLERVIRRLLDEGRAGGRLEAGGISLAAAGKTASAPGERPALSFPGKVHVFPGIEDQLRGEDPFGPTARAYIADTGHHRIIEARVERDAEGWPTLTALRTFGGGEPGFEDGSPTRARFRGPQGIARIDLPPPEVQANSIVELVRARKGPQPTLWVADTENHAVRTIDLSSGDVHTVAGNGKLGRAGRPSSRKPREVSLRSPWDVAPMTGGAFIAMAGAHQIWVLLTDRDNQIGPLIGDGHEEHGDGPFREAALAQPSGLSRFAHLLFFVDSETSSIRVADLRENQVMTVVGRGLFEFGDADGPPDDVLLQHPLAVVFADDQLYVADTFNNKIKVIKLEGGHTRTLVGGSKAVLREPGGLVVLGEFLLVADTGNHRLRAVNRTTGEIRDVPIAGL